MLTVATWRLYARNTSYERVGEIDTAAKLTATLRFNDVGSWVLALPVTSPSVDLLPLDGSGIILRRDDVTVFSGPITTIEREPYTITYSGVTDEIILADRLALPVSGLESYTAAEYDYRSGVASTVMRQYLDQNTSTGGGAQPDRDLPQVSFPADPVIGNTIEARARFTPLLELLQECALAGGGLRFRLTQSDETASVVYFYVEEPAVAEAAVFSAELGNLDSWTDIQEGPSANYVYAGGRGLNENRPIVEYGDQSSVLAYGRRVERFLDVRETEDSSAIRQVIATELEEGAGARVVKLTPIDTPATTYVDDYNLGDLATVVIEGTSYTGVIREVALTFDKDGALVEPTIASPGASADSRTYRQQRELTRRVARLERNGVSIPDGSIVSTMLDPGSISNAELTASARWNAGDLRMTARGAAATGWLLCQGQEISRTTYATLFTAIGTSFNTGGESGSTFRLPDMRQRFPLGADTTYTLGSRGGAANYDMTHGHTASAGASTDPLNTKTYNAGTGSTDFNPTNHAHPVTVNSGGNASQSVLNPYLAINFEIYTGA